MKVLLTHIMHRGVKVLPGFGGVSANTDEQHDLHLSCLCSSSALETSGLDGITAASFPSISFNLNSLNSSDFLLDI